MAQHQASTSEERVPTADAEDICGVGLGTTEALSLPSGTFFLCLEGRHTQVERLPCGCTPWELREFPAEDSLPWKGFLDGRRSRPGLGLHVWN